MYPTSVARSPGGNVLRTTALQIAERQQWVDCRPTRATADARELALNPGSVRRRATAGQPAASQCARQSAPGLEAR